jgi:hypothetical protein
MGTKEGSPRARRDRPKSEPIRSWSSFFGASEPRGVPDVVSTWFESVARLLPNPARASAPVEVSPAHRPLTKSSQIEGQRLPRVTIDLRVHRRAEVVLKLDRLDAATLAIQAFRSKSRPAVRASAALDVLSGENREIRVKVDVPDDVPPGLYRAAIVDTATLAPRGQLTLRIG